MVAGRGRGVVDLGCRIKGGVDGDSNLGSRSARPRTYQSGGAPTHSPSAAAHATWQILRRKWRTVCGGLDLNPDEAHPLGFWRKVMREPHGR